MVCTSTFRSWTRTARIFCQREDPEQNTALRHAIGGILETLPVQMAFLCPNVNSYHHFGAQFYVPNSPSCGLDKRTVAMRVPIGSADGFQSLGTPVALEAGPTLSMTFFQGSRRSSWNIRRVSSMASLSTAHRPAVPRRWVSQGRPAGVVRCSCHSSSCTTIVGHDDQQFWLQGADF